MKLKMWVQILLLIIYGISFIGVMCIEINFVYCLLGMIGCGVSMFLLDQYGTILDKINSKL